jgi:hypothetical protein
MEVTTKYGTPAPHDASNYKVNQNTSVMFQNPGASYSKNKRQSTQFVFETSQLVPGRPQSFSADTATGVFGARGSDALSNPAGRTP